MNTLETHNNSNLNSPHLSSDYLIREGVYGAKIIHNNEPIYLRMERLTEETAKYWEQYKEMSKWIGGSNRSVLHSLIYFAGDIPIDEHYELGKKATDFSKEEFNQFIEKAIALKKKRQKKTVEAITNNGVGSDFMHTYFKPEEQRYIIYATKNPQFSILGKSETMTLKNYIESYGDILISVGSDFTEINSFHNRGISRNPWWVFEEKYAGLSMLLHGFSGAVAEKHFPEKEVMKVVPVGSMQSIISKTLQKGDGFTYVYKNDKYERVDLTDVVVSPDGGQGYPDHIKVSGLSRIFNKALGNPL
jgi:hypothetical protein